MSDPIANMFAFEISRLWSFERVVNMDRSELSLAQVLDVTPPGPALIRLTEEALAHPECLSPDERQAVLRATERLIAYAQYQQFLLIMHN
jgi:hypothetical protein